MRYASGWLAGPQNLKRSCDQNSLFKNIANTNEIFYCRERATISWTRRVKRPTTTQSMEGAPADNRRFSDQYGATFGHVLLLGNLSKSTCARGASGKGAAPWPWCARDPVWIRQYTSPAQVLSSATYPTTSFLANTLPSKSRFIPAYKTVSPIRENLVRMRPELVFGKEICHVTIKDLAKIPMGIDLLLDYMSMLLSVSSGNK